MFYGRILTPKHVCLRKSAFKSSSCAHDLLATEKQFFFSPTTLKKSIYFLPFLFPRVFELNPHNFTQKHWRITTLKCAYYYIVGGSRLKRRQSVNRQVKMSTVETSTSTKCRRIIISTSTKCRQVNISTSTTSTNKKNILELFLQIKLKQVYKLCK